MKSNQLHDLWMSPDNTRLTSKQFSFRLPVHIAAKIAALCEIYPQKNRTHIVADLLTTAIDELEKHLPEGLGNPVEPRLDEALREHQGEAGQHYYLAGTRGRFRDSANQHFSELEKELGNENPELLYPEMVITEDQVRKSSK